MSDIVRIGRRLPFPSKVQIAVFLAICAWSVVMFLKFSWQFGDVVYTFLIFGGFACVRILLDLGHAVWYDGEGLYVRSGRIGWLIGRPDIKYFAFDDIERVFGDFGRIPDFQRQFMPFDHIVIEGESAKFGGAIVILPSFLVVDDVRALLIELENRGAGTIDPEVIEFAHSSTAW